MSPGLQYDIQTSIDLLPLGKQEYNLYVTLHYIRLTKWVPSWRKSTHVSIQIHLRRWHANKPKMVISLVLHCKKKPPHSCSFWVIQTFHTSIYSNTSCFTIFNTFVYSSIYELTLCHPAIVSLSPYHLPGVADIVGFFSNFSQFVYMPRQWGVHRNCNDLAAQGNAILADITYRILLNTEKALKQNPSTVHL